MRIVDLNKLSEEERKKVLEEQQTMLEQRQQASAELQRQENQKFNELVDKSGEYDTNRHTTTIGNLRKAYNNNDVKKNLNDYYNKNKTSLWEQIKGIASGTGKTVENTWLGLGNGVKSFQQTLGRATTNSQVDRLKPFGETNNEILNDDLKNIFSTDKMKEDNKEVYSKIQDEKEKNTQKIQENADSIKNPVGKYLAGNIMPAIGQMAPGLISGGAGATYFIGSATGNYYDDAKQRGMSEDEATKYSGIMGIIEGSLESVGAKLTTNVGKQLLKKNIKGALVNYGLDIGENFLEESIVEPISELVAETTAGKDKANWENIGQRFLQSGIDGAVTSMITGGVSGIVGGVGLNLKNNKYTDINTGKLLNKDSQSWLKKAENIIGENQNTDLQQNATKNQINSSIQQTTQQENKVVQNGNINEFNGYTQKEINNIKSNKISIAQSNEDISQFVSNSRKVPGNFKMYLGKINESASNIIKNNLGINVDNYNISLKTDDVRKIFKDHGSEKTEIPRGQLPITENDFLNIPNIINNPDAVSEAGKTSQGKPAIKFEKNIDGNNVVVTYVSDKHNNLELQTMYKFKNNKKIDSATVLHENQTPGLNTSEMDSGTNLFINNSIPQVDNKVNDNTINNNYAQNNENNAKSEVNLPTKGETIDWNTVERPEGKIRKHYRSIIESSNTTKEAKAIAKELMGTDTYVPETNKGQLSQADYRINNSSPDAELQSLMSRATQGEKIDSVDIAVGERLIQYYSKIGDKDNLQNAIQATAMAGTSAGQTVQALAILNHQTPQGQATWIQRAVDKMNNELAKRKGGTITKDEDGNIKVINKRGKDITDKVDLFNLTPDMVDKIVNSKNKSEMYDNIDQVYEDLGQQVPLSTTEKIDSWRYFSMLANPKTHIRNIVGNIAMGKTQSFKDKLAGGIEDIIGTFNKDMERTKTLKPADIKTKEFAKSDVLNPDVQSMMELNENKYNPQSRLQNARKTFKNDALDNTLGRLFNWNDKLLEAEDALGLKSNYKKALSNYLTANKINVDNITDTQLSKARNYAVEQAKEATFHQTNAIATAINQFSKKNGLTKGITDAVLPFVKTPMNVAKTGMEYNPTGLLKTITYDTVQLRKGNITVNKYIDNLSKGLTGTGIAVLGYALADAGILKASGGDDDKKEKYDEALGKQTYSITIGDKTYSLDWLAPVGIPLFVGAEAKAMKDSRKEEKSSISSDDDKKFNQAVSSLENLANAMANSMSPMSEMSMISGLTSALKSYEQDSTKMLGTMGTNAVKSYVNQFVPTLLGQVARTTDDYERSTTSTKTGVLSKAIDQTKLQVMSKIPGLRQKLPTKNDIWGNEQKSESNLPLRIVNNFANPATVKNVNTSKVDEELDNLYNKIGESSILPSIIEKTYTINGQIYRMTNEEYSEYRKNYGQTSYKLLDDLINSNDYNKLSDEQKQKAIENIYSYAKEVNKVDYAKNKNETVKTSTLYDTLEELKQKGGNQSSYLNYIAKTKDITGEDSNKKKIGVLAESNYTDKTKEIIYKNTEGSKDKKIIVVDKLGLPINEYLKYKSQKFESDKNEDGETLKGSKNQKIYNYLNNISDKDLSQDYKKIICKISGINSYDKDIVNMINNNKKLTVNERTEILTNIGFKIDKQGRIQTSSVLPLVKYVK